MAVEADPVTLEVRALADLDLFALRDLWRERIGPAPKMRSAELLRLLLAWRIQADAYGGLDAQTAKAVKGQGPLQPRQPKIAAGGRVSREWKGRMHTAEAVEGGYLYAGQRYPSLSAVAREITGVRWNGPRFFGLRSAA